MDQNTEQHTSVGGRFIAGFAAAGIALALAVSMWSIRSADSAENKAHNTVATTQNNTTTSTRQPKPDTEASSTASTPPWQPVATDTAVITNDPYLPPYALTTPQSGNDYTSDNVYTPQPTTKWLAEAGKVLTQQQVPPQQTAPAPSPTSEPVLPEQDWTTLLPWVPTELPTLPPLPPLPGPHSQPQNSQTREEPTPSPTASHNNQAPRSAHEDAPATE